MQKGNPKSVVFSYKLDSCFNPTGYKSVTLPLHHGVHLVW